MTLAVKEALNPNTTNNQPKPTVSISMHDGLQCTMNHYELHQQIRIDWEFKIFSKNMLRIQTTDI